MLMAESVPEDEYIVLYTLRMSPTRQTASATSSSNVERCAPSYPRALPRYRTPLAVPPSMTNPSYLQTSSTMQQLV